MESHQEPLTIIPIEVGNFVPPRTLPPATIKVTYFQRSPIRIQVMGDGTFRVQKESTGCVCSCSGWSEAMGVRRAAMERYQAIERALGE